METSSVYMCFPCYQEFPSLEEVLAHQLTCNVEAPAHTPAQVPQSSQEHTEAEAEADVEESVCALTPDMGGSELWSEDTEQRRAGAGDAPRILYQCGDCELLFDSLGLWQQHRKQGGCQQGAQEHSETPLIAPTHTHTDAGNLQPPEEGMETEARQGGAYPDDGQAEATNEASLEAVRVETQVCVSETSDGPAAAPASPPDPPVRRRSGVKRVKPPSSLLCVECGAGFSAISELVSHRRSQHGLQEALHRCAVCGEGFLNTTLFLYHRKQHPQPHPVHTLAHTHTSLLGLQQDVQVELLDEESHGQGLLLLAAAGEGQSLASYLALPSKLDSPHMPIEVQTSPTNPEATPTDDPATPTNPETTPTNGPATPTDPETTHVEVQTTPTDPEATLINVQATPTENQAILATSPENQTNELEKGSQEEGESPDRKRLRREQEVAAEGVSVCETTGTSLCRVCGSSFSSEGALKRHGQERHGHKGALHACGVCGQEFMNTTQYLYHRKQHRIDIDTPAQPAHANCQPAVEDSGEAACGDFLVELPEDPTTVPLVSVALATDATLSEPIPPPPAQLSRDWSRAALPHRCPHCGRSFTRRSLLRAHVSGHTGQKLFRCHVCAKAFSSPANLLRHTHTHTHTHQRPHRCHICTKDFSQPATLKRHMLTHTRPGAYRRRRLTHTHTLRTAIQDGDAQGPHLHTCPDCPASFRMNTQLQKHRLLHTSHPFSCEICSEAFKRRKDLDLHSLSHQEPKSCPHCSAQFLNQTVLQVHLQRCPGNQVETGPETEVSGGRRGRGQGRGKAGGQLECEMCGHRCVTQEGLELHRLSHTGQTPLRCPLLPCRRRFATGAALGEHVLAHCQGRQGKQRAPSRYRCQHCAKEFAYASTFAVHMRIHTDERPFECSTCGKRFRQLPHLQDHERIHSGLRPFACWVCGKSFSVAARLTEHARVHSGEKPYTCPRCPTAFRSRANLDKHLHIHADEPHGPETEALGEGESAVQTILLVHQAAPSPPHADNQLEVPEGAGTTLILPADQASSSGMLVPGSPSSVVILHPTITVPTTAVPNISVVEGQDVPHTIEFIIEETV
ncbi:zinc finger protein 574 isoform X3 [Alosa pseudoharengus]